MDEESLFPDNEGSEPWSVPSEGGSRVDRPTDVGLPPTLPDTALAPRSTWPTIPGYEVLGELGHGGMGVVYKARQTKAKRLFALKIIRRDVQANREVLARF